MTRHVLVTGAAGGIGQAVCTRFVAAGDQVTGLDLADAPAGASWTHVSCDLSVPGAARDAGRTVNERLAVDVVVHTAAVQVLGPAGQVSSEDWARSLQVNLLALDELVGACEHSLRTRHGSVVAIGSVHAFATTRDMVAYATTKAALGGWVRAAALDLAPQVRVNGLAPGAVRTPMLEAGFARRPGEGGVEESLRALADRTPLRTVAAPEAIAAMVATLCDDDVSGYVTGSMVVMDGGALLRLGTE